MDLRLILDLVIAVLLVATIGYAVQLNRRLLVLRASREELVRLIQTFNEATLRAESSIPKLRKAADEAGVSLAERVEKAQTLRDDIAFMIERADSLANRLEGTVRSARGGESRSAPQAGGARPQGRVTAPSAPAGPPAQNTYADVDDDRSEAERELLRALQSVR